MPTPPAPTPTNQESSANTGKATRRKTGCLNCRARRKKCDEVKPTCSRCQYFNDSCRWDKAFRIHTFDNIEEKLESGAKRRKIRTSSVEQPNLAPSDTASNATPSSDLRKVEDDGHATEELTPSVKAQALHSPLEELAEPTRPPGLNRLTSTDGQMSTAGSSYDIGESAQMLPPVVASSHYFHDIDLGTLDYLASSTSNIDAIAHAVQNGQSWSPQETLAMPTVDSTSSIQSPTLEYTNAQYNELQSTLHQHMIETARSTALNRRDSVNIESDIHRMLSLPATPLHAVRNTPIDPGPMATSSLSQNVSIATDLVSPRRHLELWRNYLDEIAPWLDMLDRDQHFQTTVPNMARTAPHLLYSILALSARQIELRSNERSHPESLALYQRAIQMIAHRLQQLETEVITACVLLCVLEMMCSSPRAWARHLDGCAMLLEAAGINGDVGGVRQAVFWCFARMDVWGGYLGDSFTRIPTHRWFIPSGTMATAVSRLKNGGRVDTYANYAVFLCASVINVISTQEIGQARGQIRRSETMDLYTTRWKALFDLLEDWYNDRPDELLPLIFEETPQSDYQNPFPIVLYATSLGVTGNQMYHAAALLMLQQRPKQIRLPKSKKSVFWHARQICGITASNTNHGAWVNALQPLWMAGKTMSHPSEHYTILELLARIERETGWATEHRARDLKEYWGDVSE